MYTCKEQAMNKPLKEQLANIYGKAQPEKPQERRRERLSESEWKDIMGINRPIYARAKGGALRQR
ncbi:hypothetical protein K0H71_15120 [Bacillus sp. IITD106]|nr:hypothetical protein [Bacillus sp. IITD106]